MDITPLKRKLYSVLGPEDREWNQGKTVTHLAPFGANQSIEYEIGEELLKWVQEKKPEIMVEIGTFRGFSTLWLLMGAIANDKGVVHTYDWRPLSLYGQPLWETFRFPKEKLRTHIAKNGVWNCNGELPKKIDMVFHDASHYLDQTKLELETLAQRVQPGGVMLFHDVKLPLYKEIADFLRDFFLKRPTEWQYHVQDLGRGLGIAERT